MEKSEYDQQADNQKVKFEKYQTIFGLKHKEYIQDIEENIHYIDQIDVKKDKKKGIAILTNYSFQFKENTSIFSEQKQKTNKLFKIPYFLLLELKKTGEKIFKSNESSVQQTYFYNIELSTKDNRNLKFLVETDKPRFFENFYSKAFPKKSNREFYIYAQEYAKSDKFKDKKVDGWKIYDIAGEFKRQGLDENRFVLSNINKGLNLCQSYPEILAISNNFSKENTIEASNFRTRKRFPVVTYYCKEYKTALLRSSQTKTGLMFSRSEQDEKYLESFREENEYLDIYDARPYINAFAMKFKGAGFENTDFYKNTRIHFCDIENIHFVRGAQNKLFQILNEGKIYDNKKYFSSIESCGWFNQISIILEKSHEIVNSLKKNCVLVHCSDGWDRTAQLCAMAQLLLDPFYRTIYGFSVLIEKEWISFGHQFAYRSGLHFDELSENNFSPVFFQYLECVYQLVVQFPQKFEFKVSMLEFIADHIYSGRYGTFLFNNDYQRQYFSANLNTVSIWTDIINHYFSEFVNPFFNNSNYVVKSLKKQITKHTQEIKKSKSFDKNENKGKLLSLDNSFSSIIKNFHLEQMILNKEEKVYFNSFNEHDILEPEFSMIKLVLWEEYYLKFNPIQSKKMGKFEVSVNDKSITKYSNTLDFIYDDKEFSNKFLESKEEELINKKNAIYDYLYTLCSIK